MSKTIIVDGFLLLECPKCKSLGLCFEKYPPSTHVDTGETIEGPWFIKCHGCGSMSAGGYEKAHVVDDYNSGPYSGRDPLVEPPASADGKRTAQETHLDVLDHTISGGMGYFLLFDKTIEGAKRLLKIMYKKQELEEKLQRVRSDVPITPLARRQRAMIINGLEGFVATGDLRPMIDAVHAKREDLEG